MEKVFRGKLKVILIAFILVSIPIAYIVVLSLKLDKANKAYEEVIIFDDDSKIDLAIQKIDAARKFVFWKSNLLNQKVQLLYRKKKYREILKCSENIDAYLFKGLIYEHLNQSDSAHLFYKKEIPELKKSLKDYRNNENLLLQVERQIALVYTFLGETEKAREYLRDIPENYDFQQRESIQIYDFYIESYKSGGFKDFLEGETAYFDKDSISKSLDFDSLVEANRFYFNGNTVIDNSSLYEIKTIFEQKALVIGMNKSTVRP